MTSTGSTPNGSIDNFHIIEDSLREVRRDLPPGYDELLPKLVGRCRLSAILVFTPWPWHWSPTPTASWTRRGSRGSSGRFRKVPR